MRYMLDKIDLHSNKDEIKKIAAEIVKILKEDEKLDDSEKILTI